MYRTVAAHNPLVTHIFTADPNAVVYGDRVYLYVSHDVDGQDDYDMVDYRGFRRTIWSIGRITES